MKDWVRDMDNFVSKTSFELQFKYLSQNTKVAGFTWKELKPTVIAARDEENLTD